MKMLFLNLTWVSVFTRLSGYKGLCSKANVFLTEICYFKHSENKKKVFKWIYLVKLHSLVFQ